MATVRKAVFPVAGLGTRFLPATKASPKEMLPVVDKPLIQYAVEEAAEAGVTEMIFVTGRNKRSIEDHFDRARELETALEANGKTKLLAEVRSLPAPDVSYLYTRQADPLGLGHAILCAKPLVKDEPFAVILADDLIDAEEPVLKQMVDMFEGTQRSILGIQRIPRHNTQQYGIVSTKSTGIRVHEVTGIVEKPKPQEAPSTLGVVGRYILTPAIFDYLERLEPGAGGEIQLSDGIAALLQSERVLAYEFIGTRYDCGSKLGYLQAILAYAVKHPELGPAFTEHLKAHYIRPRKGWSRPGPYASDMGEAARALSDGVYIGTRS